MPRTAIDPILDDLPLFEGCTRRERRLVNEVVCTIDVAPGHVLMQQGDVAGDVMIVARGEAIVWKDGLPIATLRRGAVVGELSLLVDGPRNATVVAETPMTLAVISGHGFRTLIDTVPAVASNVLVTAVRRLAPRVAA
jgi:CRP-like cAMP-binding protein